MENDSNSTNTSKIRFVICSNGRTLPAPPNHASLPKMMPLNQDFRAILDNLKRRRAALLSSDRNHIRPPSPVVQQGSGYHQACVLPPHSHGILRMNPRVNNARYHPYHHGIQGLESASETTITDPIANGYVKDDESDDDDASSKKKEGLDLDLKLGF